MKLDETAGMMPAGGKGGQAQIPGADEQGNYNGFRSGGNEFFELGGGGKGVCCWEETPAGKRILPGEAKKGVTPERKKAAGEPAAFR